jgi:integrase
MMPRLPKVKVDDPQWEWYRSEEAARLVAVARDEWERALLLFPLATGARMGKQIAIRWGDVDWMSRMIHIRQSAPGGKAIAGTKSGRHRAVLLTPELSQALRAIEHGGEWIFVNDDGTRLRPGQMREHLCAAQRRAGLRQIPWTRTSAQLRQCAGVGRRSLARRPAVARPLVHHHQREVRTPRSGDRRQLHQPALIRHGSAHGERACGGIRANLVPTAASETLN